MYAFGKGRGSWLVARPPQGGIERNGTWYVVRGSLFVIGDWCHKQWTVGRFQLAVGSRQKPVCSWQAAVESWRFGSSFRWKPESSIQ